MPALEKELKRPMIYRRGTALASAVVASLLMSWPAMAQNAPVTEAPVRQAGPFDSLIIRNVTVIDGSGAPPVGPMDIYIEKNRITKLINTHGVGAMGEPQGAADPTAVRVIDGTGLYAMPGLIDVHMHIIDGPEVPRDTYYYKLLIGSGVTTVKTFNVGSMTPAEMIAEKNRIETSKIAAPRLFLYPIFGRADPKDAKRYEDPAQTRKIVDEWAAMGIDGVKILSKPGLWPDIYYQITDEARKHNMGVAVHIGQDGVGELNAVQVAEGGATSIEHHYGYAESAFVGQTLQDLPRDYNYTNEEQRFEETAKVWQQADKTKLFGEVVDRLVVQSKEHNFFMVPTFAAYEKERDPTRLKSLAWFNDYAPPGLAQHWWPNPKRHTALFFEWTSNKEAAWSYAFRDWMKLVNDYKNKGGNVAVGSDPFGGWYSIPGFYTVRELELLEEAGFSPAEVIRAATYNGAQNLGAKDLGLLRVGYLADILILRESPWNDLKVFYPQGLERWDRVTGEKKIIPGIKYTIKNGVIYDTQMILKEVRDSVAADKKIYPPPR